MFESQTDTGAIAIPRSEGTLSMMIAEGRGMLNKLRPIEGPIRTQTFAGHQGRPQMIKGLPIIGAIRKMSGRVRVAMTVAFTGGLAIIRHTAEK
jgi:hypothetical protein